MPRLRAEDFTFDVRPPPRFDWTAGMILAGASDMISDLESFSLRKFCDIQHLMSERQDKTFTKLSESLGLGEYRLDSSEN